MKRNPSPAEPSAADPPPTALPAVWQIVVSVALVVHLLALITAPMQMAAAGSPAIRPLALLQPYVNLLHLNHAYFFFAPNPGPNHLVRYELDLGDGHSAVGEFPDRREQWPRLLYHRYFMLSETLHTFYEPPMFAPEPQLRGDSPQAKRNLRREKSLWEEQRTAWQKRHKIYEALRQSISDHLIAETGAKDVTLIRREHRPLQPWEFRDDRLQLTDDETYRNLPEVPPAEELPWNPVPSR